MPALDWTALPNVFEMVADAVEQYLPIFIPLAQKLLGVGVLFSGGWLLIKETLTNSMRNALAALMLLLMQAAIALAVITQWPVFANIVHNLQTDLSMALGGGSNAIVTAITPITNQFGPLWDMFAKQMPPPAPATGSFLEAMVYSFGEMLQALYTIPLTMLMAVITGLLMGLTVAVLAGTIMFAEISVVIGLVVAPLLIAMNFLPYMNFTIDGWVRFMLGAILMKVVAMLATLIMGAALQSVFSLDLHFTGTMGARLAAMTIVLGVTAMFLYAAIKVDDITRALMSGGAVGGPGAKVVSTGMQHAGASAAGVAGGAAAGAAAASGRAMGGAARGVARGAARGAAAGGKAGLAMGGRLGGAAAKAGSAMGSALGGAGGAVISGVVGSAKGAANMAAGGARGAASRSGASAYVKSITPPKPK